jgi:hypothetical protein
MVWLNPLLWAWQNILVVGTHQDIPSRSFSPHASQETRDWEKERQKETETDRDK